MERHVESVHEGIKPKKSKPCEICQKVFSDRQGLMRHMKSHESGKEELLPCDICGRTYNGKSNLSQHKRDVHSGTSACPII